MASNYNRRSSSSGSSYRGTPSGGSSRTMRGSAAQPRYIEMPPQRGRAARKASAARKSSAVDSGPRSSASYGRGVRADSYSSYLEARRGPRRRRERGVGLGPIVARVLIVLIVIAVFGVGGMALYFSNLFPIQNVQVAGASHLTREEVAQLAAVPADSTMLRVDTAAIEQRLEQNGWVRSASVTRVLPGTLQITITEREVAAVVVITSTEDQQDESWIIDADGTWLMELPEAGSEEAASVPAQVYEDAENVLRITNVPYGSAPVSGTKCTDDAVLNALAIVSGLTTNLADSIVQVSATDEANTTLILDNGVEIAFGEAEDIRLKERVCLELMEQHPGEISYINVRVADRPTWRSI
ncbi:MAG: FtsQ-type POTRA domain-containing protein [Eggerthellaceae bacterium]|nr:FtsQ-type POTRA domain-containing protein [Eggerthellaceae bacterium]